MTLAFFSSDGGMPELLTPNELARSLWSPEQMHGVAASGALGRGLETALLDAGRGDLRPARYTLDLFRPALMAPSEIRTKVVREGRRIMLIDAELIQGDTCYARASATFLKPTEAPTGETWGPTWHPSPPPATLDREHEDPHYPVLGSFDNGTGEWSQDFSKHQNALRKQNWQLAVPIVDGEEPSPFAAATSHADSTNLIINWGTEGVQFINTDVTVTFARLPESTEMGVSALDRIEADGIAVGATTLYDRRGAFATAVITSLANALRTVDLSGSGD